MKKTSILFLILIGFFCQAFAKDTWAEKKMPAAWIWSIANENRRIFLLGEFHVFLGLVESQVDFEFGESILSLSSSIYIEADKIEKSSILRNKSLFELLGVELTQTLNSQLLKVVEETNFSTSEKKLWHAKLMHEIDGQSPIFAESSLRYFSTILQAKRTNNIKKLVLGLAKKFSEKNSSMASKKIILHIEDNDLIDTVWVKNCDTNEATKKLIGAALDTFNPDYFWNTSKVTDLQNIFRDYYSAAEGEEKLMTYWLDNYPASSTLIKCNILPRNSKWEEKIRSLLNSTGNDVSVIVGVAHLLGKKGLLQSLQADGAYKIERIYTLDDVKKSKLK